MAWYDKVGSAVGLGPVSKLPETVSATSPINMLYGMTHPETNKFQPTAYVPAEGAYQIADKYGSTLGRALVDAQGRTTPTVSAAKVGAPATVADPDLGAATQTRGQQQTLGEALRKRATGETKSAAEMQLDRSLSKQIAAQRAQAASARGISSGMAQRLAAEGISTAQSEAAAQAAQLRAEEQAQAEQTLAGYLSGVRGQDIDTARMEQERALTEAGYGQQAMLQQSGYQQEAALANQQAELQARQQMDNAVQSYIAMGMSREDAQQRALAEMEALKAQQSLGTQQIMADIARQNVETKQKAQAGLLSTAGSIAGAIFSDERVKTDVKDVPKKTLGAFLASLKGKSYNYKSPEYDHDPGDKHVGVMAQSLEKTKLGKSAVKEMDGTKQISLGRALQLLMAGEGHLYREIQGLKKARAAA